MHLILLTYKAPVETIDALKQSHYTNPRGLFAKGMVHLAGPLIPRTGGLIIAEGPRPEIESALASDPFIHTHAAEAQLIEFLPTWRPTPTTR
ncbi:YciI family protein [Nocardia pseudobrasiliensis]|uniref:Uncharacterized protein YciI n=1 Tax=Nocardia pseudobrasiliensis TaxID=45979 RepID=A0A370I2M4_9NOCA|nr:hypothetical protein [Nocardia pseudobrasiliensis]RDI64973.1 uncharacterized protein YciI [Nocardia pseudobrasiliensis]